MFTGIIERIGKVVRVSSAGEAVLLGVDLGSLAEGVRVGDSVAAEGACLTATRIIGPIVEFDVSAETLRVTTLGSLRVGSEVNVERSLRIGGRIGGHFVLGHVDCVGTIASLDKSPGQARLEVVLPQEVVANVIPKGSIAVDGISLTIAELRDDRFAAAIIPHTFRNTTLRNKRSGDRVNVELDVLGKYVARLLGRTSSGEKTEKTTSISEEFLTEHGFM